MHAPAPVLHPGGGPRLGEPGCSRELISAEDFCANLRIAGDKGEYANTFPARARPWFAEHELR